MCTEFEVGRGDTGQIQISIIQPGYYMELEITTAEARVLAVQLLNISYPINSDGEQNDETGDKQDGG